MNTISSQKIPALTFDANADTWEGSRGFIKREIPPPALDERVDPRDVVSVIIKMRYAGLCGTDRGIWERQVFRDLIHDSLRREGKSLRILGHEFVGKVAEVGSQVENLYGIKVGDDVSGDSHATCGRCFQCRVGEEEVCQDQAILGISIDGIFAPYVKILAKNLWAVDFARVRPEIAALFDPFGNAVHACSKVDLRGKRVAILGCGPIGMFTILLARSYGAAKIIVADIDEKNLSMAERLGVDYAVRIAVSSDPHMWPSEELVSAVNKLTYSKGVDAAFEMAGPNASVVNAIEITRGGGDVILFGLKDGDFMIPRFNRAIVKGLTFHGVIGRQIFTTWQTSQRMLSDRKNGIQDAIWNVILNKGEGAVIPFSAFAKDSFERAMKEHPKIVLSF